MSLQHIFQSLEGFYLVFLTFLYVESKIHSLKLYSKMFCGYRQNAWFCTFYHSILQNLILFRNYVQDAIFYEVNKYWERISNQY